MELATKPEMGMTSRYDDDVFNNLAIQGNFLPRVQLYTSKSSYVEKGIMPANTWGIVKGKDKIEELGQTFVAYPLATRPMALDLSGEKAVAYYNPTSAEFKDCVQKSAVQNSQRMAGNQFLIYIKDHGYATLFCASKSAKAMAPHVRKLIHNFVQFGSHTVDTGKWVYRAPDVVLSNVQFDLPDVDDMKQQASDFINVTAVVETEKDLEGLNSDDNNRVR